MRIRVGRHAQRALADVLADPGPRNTGEVEQANPAVPQVVRRKGRDALSSRSAAILRLIATPISEGFSPAEVSRDLGISTKSVSTLLAQLRNELEREI
jgi:DNA-binding CsgD family transcriptional regulator